jgi:signal transduction histidine kinase
MEKSHNVMLSMINACVSHEMRNPLNSIIAQNIEKKEVYLEMEELAHEFKSKKHKKNEFL